MKNGSIFVIVIAFLLGSEPIAFGAPIHLTVEAGTNGILPGTTFDVLFTIHDQESTPLFGYSLDINIVPEAGASGLLSANIDLTNFFDSQNLITAAGATRDPLFSDIMGTNNGGVFITTNAQSGETVLAEEGVNDVLAQVFFDVSADAFGEFTVELGPASTVGTVDFEYVPHTFTVVPEPSTLFICLAGVAAIRKRRGE
jgi:hypothetical protein